MITYVSMGVKLGHVTKGPLSVSAGAELGQVSSAPRTTWGEIPTLRRPRLGKAVVEDLLGRIVSGRLPPASSLPPEKTLCTIYDVSRTVIREALKVLEEKRLVRIRHGQTSIVSPRDDWELLDPLVLHAALKHDDRSVVFSDLVHVRARLESEMARRAAELMTSSDLAEMEGLLHRLSSLLGSPGEYQASDYAFHDCVMRASDCPLSRSIVRSLHAQGMTRSLYRGDSALADLVKYVHVDHGTILENLRQRDPGAAAKAMYDHVIRSLLPRSGHPYVVGPALRHVDPGPDGGPQAQKDQEHYMHIRNTPSPKPTSKQLAFQDLELGLFIHYGLPTYTGTANTGQHSPTKFDPENLDCDNWMETAKAMGARFAVLTTRHEEGFCLWPTETTSYSVASSPYRDGQGDVVREFIEACERHGIAPCLYHPSMHDAHHVFKLGDPVDWPDGYFASTNKRLADRATLDNFIEMQRQQVRELLTNYGPITYLWLDHMVETHGIIEPGIVTRFWDAIIEEARRWQPDCLLLKCEIYLSRDRDARTGVHGGRASYPMWHACHREDLWESLREPVPDPLNGAEYVVWESNTIFSGDWFWNGEHDMKSVDQMVEHYYATIGRGSTFLPNFAPAPSGRMTDAVLSRAREFGNVVRSIYERPVAIAEDVGGRVAELVTNQVPVAHIEIMEDLSGGQKVAAYRIEALRDGTWDLVVKGESIGHKRLHKLDGLVADKIRLTCTEDFGPSPVAAVYVLDPVRVRRFAAYR